MITLKQWCRIVQNRRLVQQLSTTRVCSYETFWELEAFTVEYDAHGHGSVDGKENLCSGFPNIFPDRFVNLLELTRRFKQQMLFLLCKRSYLWLQIDSWLIGQS